MVSFEYLLTVVFFRTDMCFQVIEGNTVLSVDKGIEKFPPVSQVDWKDQMLNLYKTYNVIDGPKVGLLYISVLN